MPRKKVEEQPEEKTPVEPVAEPKEKEETPAPVSVPKGVLVSDYVLGAMAKEDRVLLSGFQRWCEVEGYGSDRRSSEDWDTLLEQFKTREVK